MALDIDKQTNSIIGFLRNNAIVQEAKAIRNGRKYYNSTIFM